MPILSRQAEKRERGAPDVILPWDGDDASAEERITLVGARGSRKPLSCIRTEQRLAAK